MDAILQFLSEHYGWSWAVGIGGVASAILGVILKRRRPAKSPTKPDSSYFEEKDLLRPPVTRPAYSDRMAYVLAEMSALAYYQFEGRGAFIESMADKLIAEKLGSKVDVTKFLDEFSLDVFAGKAFSVDFLREVLDESGFELLSTIHVAETQGIVCKRDAGGEPGYVVVAFRGTEQKISDWLTDAKAVPLEVGHTKVHTGFHEALFMKKDSEGKSACDRVEEIIESSDAQIDGKALPVFYTGHSLGGALALLASRKLAHDAHDACYTYGGPRVANYAYFEDFKSPVYRVVNSSDIVPRVPPGAAMKLIIKTVNLLSWLTAFMPKISSLFDKLESWLDRLNGYRHHGDLRYLTDVETGQFEKVMLLPNPPAFDRILWMAASIGASFKAPVSHHQMKIYREKLRVIAMRRNS